MEPPFSLQSQSNLENDFPLDNFTSPVHNVQEPYMQSSEFDEIYQQNNPVAQRSRNLEVSTKSIELTNNSTTESDSEANNTNTLSRSQIKPKRTNFPIKRGKKRKASGISAMNIRHNDVEKNYRNRLNDNFKQLSTALQRPIYDESNILLQEEGFIRPTKSRILALARQRILALEIENQLLNENIKKLSSVLDDKLVAWGK